MDHTPHVALIVETSKQYGRDVLPRRRRQLPRQPCVETSKQYGRDVLRGIGRYLQAHGPWSIYFTERGESDSEPEWIKNCDGDGIITRSCSATSSRLARERGIAVVNVSYHRDLAPDLDIPSVNCDHHEIGRMVAEHFINRGFCHFGFCHALGTKWSEDRRDAFIDRCRQHRHAVNVFELPPGSEGRDGDWERDLALISSWIQPLPKPCGIMAACDLFGSRIIDACRRVGVRVPAEAAVVGVGNDPLFCTLSWPPLSSVDQNDVQIGYEAARLLASIMEGKPPPDSSSPILLPPKELVVRTSSDILASGDANVAVALLFIRDQASRPLAVDKVASSASLSRRELERRFRRQLGTSPYKEIQRARIQRVKNLLIHTDDTLENISEQLGFTETSNMATLFKNITGMSPGKYRKSQRVP